MRGHVCIKSNDWPSPTISSSSSDSLFFIITGGKGKKKGNEIIDKYFWTPYFKRRKGLL